MSVATSNVQSSVPTAPFISTAKNLIADGAAEFPSYRNYMMACAVLMDQRFQNTYAALFEKHEPPSVRNLQSLIERAWEAGFSKRACSPSPDASPAKRIRAGTMAKATLRATPEVIEVGSDGEVAERTTGGYVPTNIGSPKGKRRNVVALSSSEIIRPFRLNPRTLGNQDKYQILWFPLDVEELSTLHDVVLTVEPFALAAIVSHLSLTSSASVPFRAEHMALVQRAQGGQFVAANKKSRLPNNTKLVLDFGTGTVQRLAFNAEQNGAHAEHKRDESKRRVGFEDQVQRLRRKHVL
ncbi:hypothetical protein K488DRAFT_86697 [Vararia minispora EC-137]|uniref:Uncharacterized protein n=1 Tax=Vararia minispora EC-137 TaxID=1314806 RepID=A0ACB8QIS4_9AGAM|nr:hypothetical protein K488DRAFT_86697 [Vararia minispora EC-137]